MPADEMLDATRFPAPLVLDDDSLCIEPDWLPDSVKTWAEFNDKMKVTKQRKVIYVIPPPTVSAEVEALMKGSSKPKVPAKWRMKAMPRTLSPPRTEDVCDYLRAFYSPLEVRVQRGVYEWQSWSERPGKTSANDTYIGLTNTQTSSSTRVRYRTSPDKVAAKQSSLNDILDAMLPEIPDDAYAISMLTDHDLYEDDDDDFCCGRAYGMSRVSIISTFRYNPALSVYADIDLEHMWPASHCKAYIESMCEEPETPVKASIQTTSDILSLDASSPLTAAVKAAKPVMVPKSKDQFYALWLARTCRTVSHELGHCFGMDHCVYYACAMQGTGNIAEDDRQPPYLCPVCLSKMANALAIHVEDAGDGLHRAWLKQHYEALRKFCESLEGVSGMFAGLKAWIKNDDDNKEDVHDMEDAQDSFN